MDFFIKKSFHRARVHLSRSKLFRPKAAFDARQNTLDRMPDRETFSMLLISAHVFPWIPDLFLISVNKVWVKQADCCFRLPVFSQIPDLIPFSVNKVRVTQTGCQLLPPVFSQIPDLFLFLSIKSGLRRPAAYKLYPIWWTLKFMIKDEFYRNAFLSSGCPHPVNMYIALIICGSRTYF